MSLPRLTEQAKADLDEIWLQIALDDVLVADRFIDRVLSRCQLLADRPKMGRERPELRAGLRSFTIGSYLIIYRLRAGGIEVVRVLHGARDLAKLV
jgi:toxin ParE1/3/4